MNLAGVRKRLANLTERGDFWSPMGIIQPLGEQLDEFPGAAKLVLSATGYCQIHLIIDTLPATLVVVETLMQYQWQWIKKLALVRDIIL